MTGSDIVKRLRETDRYGQSYDDKVEAADLIESLFARNAELERQVAQERADFNRMRNVANALGQEIEALEGALRETIDYWDQEGGSLDAVLGRARAALAGVKPEPQAPCPHGHPERNQTCGAECGIPTHQAPET